MNKILGTIELYIYIVHKFHNYSPCSPFGFSSNTVSSVNIVCRNGNPQFLLCNYIGTIFTSVFLNADSKLYFRKYCSLSLAFSIACLDSSCTTSKHDFNLIHDRRSSFSIRLHVAQERPSQPISYSVAQRRLPLPYPRFL